MAKRAGGIVLSDRASAGEYVDKSGPVLRRFLRAWRLDLAGIAIVPDEPARLKSQLARWAKDGVDLVLASGGTGLGPRDLTPETLAAWADREVPGIGEWMRLESAKHTSAAWISRGGGWQKGKMLVVALPGSPRALQEILPGLKDIALHALEMIEGKGHG
ncbi:MAG: MogA/MoaB family molybdenum cofactor biosynthesis protein [Deltaproteobacteria bacterium]|nr:MogA/MoaB family molybdenum cofactor biosynthesis protein [Deltaproteobacteria bacterium]